MNLMSGVERYRDEIVENVCKLVSIESVSSDKEKVKEALKYVLNLADELGLKAYSCCDDQVGIVEIGQGDETMGMLTHVDVVPAGDLDQWDTPPFIPVIRENKIFGRGTLDDKGMVIACMYAMKAVKDLNIDLTKKIQLIIGTQEEVEWTDMEAYVKEAKLPDYGFTPDGEYPLENIEKGFCNVTAEFDVSKNEGCACAGLYVKKISCGIADNTVPGEAEAVLTDGRVIKVHGREAHSCMPDKGLNALFVLRDELKRIHVMENDLMTVLDKVCECFKDVYGSGIGLYNESEYYEGEFVHRNVFSITKFNADQGKAVVGINNRFPYGTEADEVVKKIREFVENLGGRLVHVESLPAVFVSEKSRLVQVLGKVYSQLSGFENVCSLAYGASYAKAMKNIVSWGPLFPDEEDSCHAANENMDIDNLILNTKIFAETIRQIGESKESFKI